MEAQDSCEVCNVPSEKCNKKPPKTMKQTMSTELTSKTNSLQTSKYVNNLMIYKNINMATFNLSFLTCHPQTYKLKYTD